MKNIAKLKNNTTNEKYWKQYTEIHRFDCFFRTDSFVTDLTSYWKRNMIPFFYRQIVAVQANFAWLARKVGLETGHRRPSHRYARVKEYFYA